MTRRDDEAPFTVCADLDLAPRPGLALRAHGADVAVRRGAVPHSLPCAQAGGPAWEHGDGLMLIRHPGGVRFLISGGDSIRYEVAPGVPAGDVGAFLFGSVWAALALQRGLLPLHASAVSHDAGAVHAFTGHSGAGKSTLAVALGAHGLAFFTDDLLLLDPASFGAKGAGARCYGSAGLRLYPRGGALTDATLGEPVRAGALKRWADPAHRAPRAVGRLRTLHVLSDRDGRPWGDRHCSIEPLAGRRAVFALLDALYRSRQALAVVGRRRLFEWLLAASTRHVQVSMFHRPRSERRFGRGVAHLASTLPSATDTGSTIWQGAESALCTDDEVDARGDEVRASASP